MTDREPFEADDPQRPHILECVERALGLVIQQLDDANRKGGYFCLRSITGGVLPSDPPTLVELLGEKIPAAKAEKYWQFCQEKAARLARNMPAGHCTSWTSRDEAAEQYGGAIVAGGYILSFSGLPEHGDEAAMTLGALMAGLISADQVQEIASFSDNMLPLELMAHVMVVMEKIRFEDLNDDDD